jgi:hypothetical protein
MHLARKRTAWPPRRGAQSGLQSPSREPDSRGHNRDARSRRRRLFGKSRPCRDAAARQVCAPSQRRAALAAAQRRIIVSLGADLSASSRKQPGTTRNLIMNDGSFLEQAPGELELHSHQKSHSAVSKYVRVCTSCSTPLVWCKGARNWNNQEPVVVCHKSEDGASFGACFSCVRGLCHHQHFAQGANLAMLPLFLLIRPPRCKLVTFRKENQPTRQQRPLWARCGNALSMNLLGAVPHQGLHGSPGSRTQADHLEQ